MDRDIYAKVISQISAIGEKINTVGGNVEQVETGLNSKLNNSAGNYTVSLIADTGLLAFEIRPTGTTGTFFRLTFFDTGKVSISRILNGTWQPETTLRNADE